uniref:Uncharacterized protein n=1 Tax=Chlamydomonas leiostraca TaxID=1034604 RepID=A0A7S0X221_9CHLO|mmetsp:Transcript_9679/g.24027  ORF Transcript_9679/g.24027 Transcript_9679/m.24027 type:complete len:134 (+) Transcript_9679:74-475(+)|eukprot:CAMPEP_0202866142 /NCGR_PEP_ID=MMETSP1391-20130828/7224_1 /ASSEMBLY_ACC=CAM_ASM_000867 /TAXON_ID=1034604 /ORGANISM="Chlamydomonas leiostraca, Strain SAG 11-49" /LENGTH=133 /DNA_ID=CAMNT_0049546065 /DNA_START=74 /DNA_END=475 /DNA_ORIENTATION=-
MSSPFTANSQVARTSQSGNSNLPDYEKPVTDVYRTSTLSDVGLWVADTLSPGKHGGGITGFVKALWAAPTPSNPPAPSTSPAVQAADKPSTPTITPITASSSTSSMRSMPSNGSSTSSTSSWSSWLWGSKAAK